MRYPLITCGVAEKTLLGESESGDGYVVRAFGNGMLVAVLDGLGHGQEAAAARRVAVETLTSSSQPSVIALMQHCHEALRFTRGVVMGMAWFTSLDDTVTWLSVGNVAGYLVRAQPGPEARDEALLQRAGLVGHKLPLLRAAIVSILPGDTIVLASDGIDPSFVGSVRRSDPPQTCAERILAEHGRDSDDALVAVVRYTGRE